MGHPHPISDFAPVSQYLSLTSHRSGRAGAAAVPLVSAASGLILETLVDVARSERDPVALTERIRQQLGVSICNALRGHHEDLAVLSLDPRAENRLIGQVAAGGQTGLLGTDPKLADQLLRRLAPLVDRMIRQGRAPVLLCAGPVRGALVRLTQRTMPQLSVISVDEVPLRVALSSFDVVKLEAAG